MKSISHFAIFSANSRSVSWILGLNITEFSPSQNMNHPAGSTSTIMNDKSRFFSSSMNSRSDAMNMSVTPNNMNFIPSFLVLLISFFARYARFLKCLFSLFLIIFSSCLSRLLSGINSFSSNVPVTLSFAALLDSIRKSSDMLLCELGLGSKSENMSS